MATQVSLNSGAVASAGTLALQTNGTTEAVSISTGQVATLAQNPILTSGTANGVAYLNGSKVLTTGSAVTYNGTTFATTADATISGLTVGKGASAVSSNTAVGASALAANTSGSRNVAMGINGLTLNTTGASNTTIGTNSLYNNTTGSNNTAVGDSALTANTTASNNTAVGYQAGYTNSTGTQNTYTGYWAGYLTTGSTNAFFGYGAGSSVTSGSKNTIIGGYNGNQGGLDIRTSSNRSVVSDGDGNVRFFHDGSATGKLYPAFQTNLNNYGFDDAQFYPNPDNTFKLGNASYRWTTVYATTGTINTSDANTKQDIASLDDAEKRVAIAIKSLIKKYRFKDAVAEKGDAARIHIGAIAQEVQAAFVAEGLDPARYALFCSDTWYEVDGKAAEPATPYTAETPNAVAVTRLGLRYEELLAFVIAAM